METTEEGLRMVAGRDRADVALADEPAVGESDMTDELSKGGPAFGTFLNSVGQAVASTQTALDKTFVETAQALSATEINVIAVYEQQLKDDDGQMDKGNVVLQKLPLINYLMPTAEQVKSVQLSATMQVSEFNAANGFNIQSRSSSFSAGGSLRYGLGGFGASAFARYGQSSFDASGGSSYGQDYAAGNLHLEATIEPRTDVQLPKPLILQKGPRLKVSQQAREELDKDGNPTSDPAKIVARRVTLAGELHRANGDPNSGKKLEFSINQPIDYNTDPQDGNTDSAGQLKILGLRKGSAAELTSPVQAIVRVWFGLISEAIGITI